MPTPTRAPITRRRFLAATTAAAGMLALGDWTLGEGAPKPDLHFFVIGDTHYFAQKDNPTQLDDVSARTTSALIDVLNRLPGTAIPEAAGGGIVGKPAGVIHAGDLIDSGDKNGAPYEAMQPTEFAAFVKDFGLNGADGRLKYPVYEIHGNHDAPAGKGVSLSGIIERNNKRPGVAGVSSNGLHYSWDWQGVHFVNLGIVVGQVKAVMRKRRYNPLESLDFLIDDLKKNVGDSARPVILTHHVDIVRNTVADCDPNAPAGKYEWDPCDLKAFYDAIKPYNVIATFYGHTHVRNVFKWDGSSAKAAEGIDVYNVTKASHYHFEPQGIFYVSITGGRFTVREYATKNRWTDAEWTPQVWGKAV